ncbi:hypothetical protein HY988_06020 [Candidatus Micrarchaeota archaeon]|nr:hypothetical protein [Candidatus Micrarchaeota archaeon]
MGAKHRGSASENALEESWANEQISSFFDINQLELACINRALEGNKKDVKGFVDTELSSRILGIQKKNLEHLCKRLRKEHGKKGLEKELNMILSGKKSISFACMMFQENK